MLQMDLRQLIKSIYTNQSNRFLHLLGILLIFLVGLNNVSFAQPSGYCLSQGNDGGCTKIATVSWNGNRLPMGIYLYNLSNSGYRNCTGPAVTSTYQRGQVINLSIKRSVPANNIGVSAVLVSNCGTSMTSGAFSCWVDFNRDKHFSANELVLNSDKGLIILPNILNLL